MGIKVHAQLEDSEYITAVQRLVVMKLCYIQIMTRPGLFIMYHPTEFP